MLSESTKTESLKEHPVEASVTVTWYIPVKSEKAVSVTEPAGSSHK